MVEDFILVLSSFLKLTLKGLGIGEGRVDGACQLMSDLLKFSGLDTEVLSVLRCLRAVR